MLLTSTTITEVDLIGQIAKFPIQVVYRMIANQVAQGNQADVTVFQKQNDANRVQGGFNWSDSREGTRYWSRVINGHLYNEPVPYTEDKTTDTLPSKSVEPSSTRPPIPKYGTRVLVKMGNSSRKVEKVIINYLEGAEYPYVVMGVTGFSKLGDGSFQQIHSVKEVQYIEDDGKIKLTLKDISEGKGVGVDPNLIQIVK